MSDTDTSDELKPCPFCNSEAFLDGKEGELVSCNNCGARAETNLWNNRPIIEEERAVRIRVEKMYGDLAAQTEAAEKKAYFEGFRDAFAAMKAMCNEETSSMLWNLRGIRKAQE